MVSGRWTRTWVVGVALLALVVAGGAQAQLEDVNTELTPKPRAPDQWTRLGGAVLNGGGNLFNGKDSATPFTVDFFSTSFSPGYKTHEGSAGYPMDSVGFFAGAECIDESTPFSEVEDCERRPAIYGFGLDEDEQAHVDRLPLDGDPTKPGFIGAVAWIDEHRALAVGGDGFYPRREPPAPLTGGDEAYLELDKKEWAGRARAWIYEDGSWRELRQLPDGDPKDELPDEMGALTALDCTQPGVTFSGVIEQGTCVAGGMQQMWWWNPADGDELEGFDPNPVSGPDPKRNVPSGLDGKPIPLTSTDCLPTTILSFVCLPEEAKKPAVPVSDFHFRVRQIRFVADNVGVTAVTSGCCTNIGVAPEEQGPGAVYAPGARLLTYEKDSDPKVEEDRKRWRSEPFSAEAGEDATSRGAPLPDSYYGFVGRSAIASPGGSPTGAGDPGSRIVARTECHISGASLSPAECTSVVTSRPVEDATDDATYLALDSVRLLAADGDFKPTQAPQNKVVSVLSRGGGDGMLDWAVGRFKKSEQGVVYTTVDSILPLPSPLTCTISVPISDESKCGYGNNVPDLVPENVTDAKFDSKRLLAMRTYALNALQFVPGTDGALGWAVGDRGALARLGGSGRLGAAAEPDAPAIKPGKPTPLSERGPFDPLRPAPSRPGAVPPLGDQPLERLPQRTLVPWGTADPTLPFSQNVNATPYEAVTSIAMSRDGSEGWAVGAGSGSRFTLQHFDGERWSRCDAGGLGGVYEPDPACESLRVLLGDGKQRSLHAIARIPLERDGDPSNDDEFEAIAIGSKLDLHGVTGATVLSYRDGRWDFDLKASEVFGGVASQTQIAFSSPDEGWAVQLTNGISGIYRYSGEWPNGHWDPCKESKCGPNYLALAGAGVENLRVQVAGDRVFAAGMRKGREAGEKTISTYPFVVSKESGQGKPWREEFSGCVLDPSGGSCRARTAEEGGTPSDRGITYSFSVVDLGDGRIAGWMLGEFGSTPVENAPILSTDSDDLTRPVFGPAHVLLRRDPDVEQSCGAHNQPSCWAFRDVEDAADELISYAHKASFLDSGLVSLRGEDGEERSFIMPARLSGSASASFPPLEYDSKSNRWGVMRAPFVSSTNRIDFVELATQGTITAVAPDERGGLWVTGTSGLVAGSAGFGSYPATFFYRYTDQRRKPVFDDTPNPVSEPITGMAGTPDGGVWVSTESDRVYHYDRIAGWERLRIEGWDPGRVVTTPSHALAVAVNEVGVGIVVGERGRIANVSDEAVALDPASGRRCSDDPTPPCGTPRNLRAAAVAPDGLAIAGGDSLALVWRPAGGEFRLIDRPRVPPTTRITGLSMPLPGHAWLTTADAEVWAGTFDGARWRWRLESEASKSRNEIGQTWLNAIALDAEGRGLAVGMRGATLERSPDGEWRRLTTGFTDHLYSVALPPSGYGDGTLLGGVLGVILTRVNGHFRIARQQDNFDPLTTGYTGAFSARIVGLTLAGGERDGQVEAWAGSQVPTDAPFSDRDPSPFALLHYGSEGDPLLHPQSRARALPDTPASEPDEVTLAAFGRTECQLGQCQPFQGTNLFNEVITRGVQSALRERRRSNDAFAGLFTGDIGSAPGRSEREKRTLGVAPAPFTPLDRNPIQNQWRDLVAEPLAEHGIPLFAVPGKTDLSRARTCVGGFACADTQQFAEAGVSLQWRQTFADMPKPWGEGDEFSTDDGVAFEPVRESASVEQPDGGAARTHYAVDVTDDGEPVARLIFIDNSFARSLTASEAIQNPIEGRGGQAAWLEQVLCVDRSADDLGSSVRDCTRQKDQPVVVVSNTPTYSYGPGGLDSTQQDGSALETLLVKYDVTAVVSGRLGWNGLYYTLAPGLHYPCPGGDYPARPPSAGEPPCLQADAPGGAPAPPTAPAAGPLVDELRGLGAPVPAQADTLTGAADAAQRPIPTVIASSAGGRFGPRGTDAGTTPSEAANEGFWHGYSVVRIRRGGEVIVEQRPILDWVGIEAQEHTLRAGQRVTLRGYGREPYGTDTSFRGYRINSPAITHRYDLVLADPQKPYLPLEDANGDYVPVPAAIATVNGQTGSVRAGKGARERTYAIGILSVGDKAATWPLVFEPRRSFVPQRAKVQLPALPRPARAPAAQPPLRIGDALAPPPTTPPSTPTSPLTNQTIQTPQPPTLPTLPGVTAAAPPPAPTLNAPPPPPPPPPAPPVPPQQQPQPLALGAKVQAVAIVPSVNPPAPPPVNPAPPGGAAARKEAKQRQAAVAKSEEGEGGAQGAEVDLGEGKGTPDGAQATRRAIDRPAPATRRERDRPAASFTALERRAQPSAWARGGIYGGGLLLATLALGLGFSGARPRPRRRTPHLPAPAEARVRRR